MNRNLPDLENARRVLLDNDKAIRMGLEHLIANGYRHIEMISNNIQLSTLNIREDSYRRAMREMGMEQFCRVTFVNEADDNEVDAALSEAVSRGPMPFLFHVATWRSMSARVRNVWAFRFRRSSL